MEFGEMKRNTSNWSNFCIILSRAGLSASAGLSCYILAYWDHNAVLSGSRDVMCHVTNRFPIGYFLYASSDSLSITPLLINSTSWWYLRQEQTIIRKFCSTPELVRRISQGWTERGSSTCLRSPNWLDVSSQTQMNLNTWRSWSKNWRNVSRFSYGLSGCIVSSTCMWRHTVTWPPHCVTHRTVKFTTNSCLINYSLEISSMDAGWC